MPAFYTEKISCFFAGVFRDERRGVLGRAAAFLLFLLSGLYLCVSILNRKLRRAAKLSSPVVSVGNIVCGGTGKTPAVEYIAGMLLERGCLPAVVSRGYMRTGGGALEIVSDGGGVISGPVESGDEPFMLAGRLPGVPVVVGRNRLAAGRLAIEKFNVSCVLLDDGFQHYSLHRDIDIVVIDSTNPFGNGHILPRGPLREKPSRLKAADLLLLTHVDYCDDISALRGEVSRVSGGKPMVETVHMPERLRNIDTGEILHLRGLEGVSAVTVSGIGSPALFERTVRGLGVRVLHSFRFPDHHAYTAEDMDRIALKTLGLGGECLITTAKDAVRMAAGGKCGVYVLDVRLRVVGGEENLEHILSPCFPEREGVC